MIKYISTYVLLIFCTNALAVNYVELRTLLVAAATDEATANLLLQKTTQTTQQNAIVLGYHAAVTMTMAKHCYLPTSKLSYFKKGKVMLEAAIRKSPSSAELKFIRLAIQCNIPSMLGYAQNISADKNELIQYLKSNTASADTDLKTRVKKLLLTCNKCTAIEIKSIQNL